MGLFSRAFGAGGGMRRDASSPQRTQRQPSVHRTVLGYIRRLQDGAPADSAFESRKLTGDLGFDSLNFAELLVALARDAGRSAEELASDVKTWGLPLPVAEPFNSSACAAANLANLVQRVAILAEQFPDEQERGLLLEKGVVGPGFEVHPLDPELDVEFVIRYCDELDL